MKTVLMISAYFPPMFDIGGKRAYRFARYLPDYGWKPVVLTDEAPRKRAADPTPIELPPSVTVVRRYYPDWWPRKQGRPSDGTVTAPVKDEKPARPSLASRARRVLRSPIGRETVLTPWVTREIAALAQRHRADVLWVTSSPYPALVYGAAAAAATGLPLVLDLRDPWTLNFLQVRKAGWVQGVERGAERALVRRASKVVFTCEAATAAYRDVYDQVPPARFATITNAFDPANRPPRTKPDGPVTIVHFGNCYGPRSLATVLRAMARVRDEFQLSSRDLRVLNLGRIAEKDLNLAADLDLAEALEYRPFVPYQEGLSILAAADLQLLLAYGHETLFIPAKVFDYLLTGAPIMCLAEPSDVTTMLESTGAGDWARPDDVDGATRMVRAAVMARQGGPPVADIDEDEVNCYAAPATARQLAELLDGLSR